MTDADLDEMEKAANGLMSDIPGAAAMMHDLIAEVRRLQPSFLPRLTAEDTAKLQELLAKPRKLSGQAVILRDAMPVITLPKSALGLTEVSNYAQITTAAQVLAGDATTQAIMDARWAAFERGTIRVSLVQGEPDWQQQTDTPHVVGE